MTTTVTVYVNGPENTGVVTQDGMETLVKGGTETTFFPKDGGSHFDVRERAALEGDVFNQNQKPTGGAMGDASADIPDPGGKQDNGKSPAAPETRKVT
jgi:hypothetical protein